MTGVTFTRVVRSEWTKLRSLRSTWIVLGGTMILTVGLAAAFGHGYGLQVRQAEVDPSPGKAIDVAFIGLDLPALIIGVLGILQMTGEYGNGLIRCSLMAVPTRWPLPVAKALVLTVVTTAVMGPAVLISFLVGQAMIGDAGVALRDPAALPAVLGATVYPVAMGAIGLGLGAVFRHTASAITVLVAAVLVLPAMLAPTLPDSVARDVLPYVPIAAAQAIYTQLPDTGEVPLLAPWSGLLVLLGWVAAGLAGGTAILIRRDA
jgi:ABC-type transport system involved in multi-copper enzyme maturation permease subunit